MYMYMGVPNVTKYYNNIFYLVAIKLHSARIKGDYQKKKSLNTSKKHIAVLIMYNKTVHLYYIS